jgi:hypothetical protein
VLNRGNFFFGLPTMVGMTDLGAQSPEKPVLQVPVPLSITIGTKFSISFLQVNKKYA